MIARARISLDIVGIKRRLSESPTLKHLLTDSDVGGVLLGSGGQFLRPGLRSKYSMGVSPEAEADNKHEEHISTIGLLVYWLLV